MYIAKHYVNVNGEIYMKGEKLPDDLPEEKIAWYKKTGAIEETVPVLDAEESENTELDEEEAEENECEMMPAPEVPDEEESDEDMDSKALEIDVMAGVIQEEEKPKKTRRSSRKQA